MKYSFLLGGIFLWFSCATPYEELPPPNILWISHEDLSPIYGCYGDDYARTPNIDQLATKSTRFNKAYSNAPICAPARSTLITGMYATSLGTQHLRSEIPVPEELKILSEVLRDAGYYTTNNVKTDYNFSHEGRWDESSNTAHWRNRPNGKPFFSVFNFMITHEGPTNALRSSDTEMLEVFNDPSEASLPPYLPDSPRMREIWAHMYDLLAVFDIGVGNLLAELEEDGLLENTIVFVFSDHGHGLPGHKRWLNNAGLQIPFILHIPDKYKHLAPNLQIGETDQLVAFVDFAPTVIKLVGGEVPQMMEGTDFLGKETVPKEYIFGYRDRADDCYEVSRSVSDGRYIYIRHFMPQLPYYQEAVIFNKGGSYEEINRLHKLGQLTDAVLRMKQEKPVEELFDLQEDPFEQENLIDKPEHAQLVDQFREKVTFWMVKHRDTGIITEGEMMLGSMAEGISVYDYARSFSEEKFHELVTVADLVGKIENPKELIPFFGASENAARFWAVVAVDAYQGDGSPFWPHLKKLLDDPSLPVAIKAAEVLVKKTNDPVALQTLEKILHEPYEPLVLQAAISVRQLGDKAMPLIPAIQQEIFPKYSGDIWDRYKSWSYPMFIGMALDQTQINCGVSIPIKK
ncbi:sulfatase-like hydrolase/transferase [Lunatibacter salilacus]|uniref:sulfatase-like hydrolase/transferase n=1 Tax=Lunatibacter salilacus TaxID=2483804 RepID=UPI00131C97ED|nr:sulfatase-like hydrolase/transferase [Lunatibacter salilacus]